MSKSLSQSSSTKNSDTNIQNSTISKSKPKPKKNATPVISTVKQQKSKQRKSINSDRPSIKIIPLGGLHEIGKNTCVFEYEDEIILLDAGLAFPSDEMHGINIVLPDMTYLQENAHKIKGMIVTHGHEDHICLLYTSPSPRDRTRSRMPSSA